ncbi:TetR/AcrR family transcriptional regulator [Streptomyces sp. NPDC002680]|uniref:TetR/AcrR family transcriptional regulator n=1 Tax=Streptomyces sp. NPDC002680 TaxID=3364659 RepID=UPI00369E3065
MARPAEGRQPAAPMSNSQAARRVRILRAASELGAREGLASVQMHDVAKEAGVAIATLYRYFPSKPYLFLAVLEWYIEQFLGDRDPVGAAGEPADPASEVAETLAALTGKLLETPLLASAVALSSFTEYAGTASAGIDVVEGALGQRLLHLLGGHDEDAAADCSRVRLLVYSWWGLFVGALTQELTTEQAGADLRLAVRLILAP